MEKRSSALLILVWALATQTAPLFCSVENANDRVNLAARELKSKSWIDWAQSKFSEYGLNKANAMEITANLLDKARDVALKASNVLNSATLDASKYASQKGGETANTACERADQVMRLVRDRTSDAKKKMSGAIAYGKEKDTNVYHQAKQQVKTDKDANNMIAGAMGLIRDRATDAYENARTKLKMVTGIASNNAGDTKEGIAEALECQRDKFASGYVEAKQKLNTAFHVASGKAGLMKNAILGAYRLNKAASLYVEADQKVDMSSDRTSHRTGDAEENVAEPMGGVDQAKTTYDEAVHRMHDKYTLVKESGSEQAKTSYEIAKEKASEAAGNLGEKMRKNAAEL